MDDQLTEASVVRERALLLEALTLLVQRQAETDAALSDELARTNVRVAAIERRSIELEERLVNLDERLSRLALEVEPDPGLPSRLAVLQAHVQHLGGQAAPAAPPAAVHTARPAPARPAAAWREPPRPEPPPRPAPRPEPVAVQHQTLVPAGDALWSRLGASNQDRASVVLIGAGVLAVAYALLAQVRFG